MLGLWLGALFYALLSTCPVPIGCATFCSRTKPSLLRRRQTISRAMSFRLPERLDVDWRCNMYSACIVPRNMFQNYDF